MKFTLSFQKSDTTFVLWNLNIDVPSWFSAKLRLKMRNQETATPTDVNRIVKVGDDFTIIDGIGSRISYVLYENNILTFGDLAASSRLLVSRNDNVFTKEK